MFIAENWKDYEVIDTSGGEKLERWGKYILLRPENIERAIDYMTEIDGIYQHNFVPSSNPKEKLLCFFLFLSFIFY